MQIVGTWDDHRYGLNDAGKEFERKDVSQQLMLDFLNEAPDSPRYGKGTLSLACICLLFHLISCNLGESGLTSIQFANLK